MRACRFPYLYVTPSSTENERRWRMNRSQSAYPSPPPKSVPVRNDKPAHQPTAPKWSEYPGNTRRLQSQTSIRPGSLRPCGWRAPPSFPQRSASPCKPHPIVVCCEAACATPQEVCVPCEEPVIRTYSCSDCASSISQLKLEALRSQQARLIELIGVILSMGIYDLKFVASESEQYSSSLDIFNAFTTSTKIMVEKLKKTSSELSISGSELGNFKVTVDQMTDILMNVKRLEIQLQGRPSNWKQLRDQVSIFLSSFVETSVEKKWVSEAFIKGPLPQLETFSAASLWQIIDHNYIRQAISNSGFPNLLSYVTLKSYSPGNVDHIQEIYTLLQTEEMSYNIIRGRLTNLRNALDGALEQLSQSLKEQKINVLKILEAARIRLEEAIERCAKGYC